MTSDLTKVSLTNKMKKVVYILVSLFIVVEVYVYFTSWKSNTTASLKEKNISKKLEYDVWPKFDGINTNEIDISSSCAGEVFQPDLEIIVQKVIPAWRDSKDLYCRNLYLKFDFLYEITTKYSSNMELPPKFKKKLKNLLKDDELFNSMKHQHLIHFYNKLTTEHSIYNPVRARRPQPRGSEDVFKYADSVNEETSEGCDFCKYKDFTAFDDSGRHETEYSVRVSNSFKVEKWHTMIVAKGHHHPTNISKEFFINFIQDSLSWISDVSQLDPEYMYPNLAWDTLYKAGASQVHPHIQMMMSDQHYYGGTEQLRNAAQEYYDNFGSNFFSDLLNFHAVLGLLHQHKSAFAFPTLAGKLDMEVMIISEFPNEDLFELAYAVLKTYHNVYKQLCYSISMAWPASGSSEKSKMGRIPAIIRIGSRNDCTSSRNDISTFELYQFVYRDHDPWSLSEAMRENMKLYL